MRAGRPHYARSLVHDASDRAGAAEFSTCRAGPPPEPAARRGRADRERTSPGPVDRLLVAAATPARLTQKVRTRFIALTANEDCPRHDQCPAQRCSRA